MTFSPTFRRLLPAALLAATLAVPGAHAAGLDLHADADLADIGLPLYPGAVKKASKDEDGPGFTFGVWGGSFDFKVDELNYQSSAEVEEVAAFYREALGRFGPVLDCTDKKPSGAEHASQPRRSGKSSAVTCGDDHAPSGGRLYEVGTENDHRTVTIKPMPGGVAFQLTRVVVRGLD